MILNSSTRPPLSKSSPSDIMKRANRKTTIAGDSIISPPSQSSRSVVDTVRCLFYRLIHTYTILHSSPEVHSFRLQVILPPDNLLPLVVILPLLLPRPPLLSFLLNVLDRPPTALLITIHPLIDLNYLYLLPNTMARPSPVVPSITLKFLIMPCQFHRDLP